MVGILYACNRTNWSCKMIDYRKSAHIGAMLGTIHGIILWAATDKTAQLMSFILYGNRYTLALYTVAIVDVVTLITVLTSGFWLPRVMAFRDKVVGEDE
jgi:hypothetical protein